MTADTPPSGSAPAAPSSPDAPDTATADTATAPAHGSVSRRAVLTGALAGAGLLGGGTALGWALAGARRQATPPHSSESDATPPPLRTFDSTAVSAPEVSTWQAGTTAVGSLFVTQQTKHVGGEGFRATILDDRGEPIWIEPTGANTTDLRVQHFEGHPVLTYWQGRSLSGHGRGTGHILDTSYREITTIRARGDMDADLHEVNLTARGTALITAYTPVAADLSALGGPREGFVYDCHAQEIDIHSGKLLFDWRALAHVPVTDTYLGLADHEDQDGTTRERAFDAFHINAVDDVGDALIISLRHTHTIYCVDRTSGDVRWRLGGKHSDFEIPAAGRFAWQHHCRHHSDGTISLFDNHLSTGHDGQSRGLRLRLDEHAGTATVVAQQSFNRHLGTAMGSAQVLPGGHTLVGWGTAPFVTEFDADGAVVFEAALTSMSYRAFRGVWHAQPHTAPKIAVQAVDGSVEARLSWNGATEVATWRVRAGADASTLAEVATVPRSGFETLARVASAATVSAQALDADGHVLGTTPAVTVRVTPSPHT